MRKWIASSAFAVTTAVVGLVGAATPALADDHFDVTVRSTVSGKCLAPQGNSFADGVPIVQTTCNGDPFQRWDFVDHDNSNFQIRNAVTLKCMDALGNNVNGTPVVQWPCANISNQRFHASRSLPDFVQLRSRVAGTNTHCLDVPGGRPDEGLALQLWVCNNTAAQSYGVFPI
ncbi:RICIN domain-containing protein [Lentzea sp. NPDC005914]|uniref:RICIN domain-containing protein n=1 Tax=Lentzea sp. NPDC005914 TaxID=3154572 RepID=UPI0033CE6713